MKRTNVRKKEQWYLHEAITKTALQKLLAYFYYYPELEFSLTELAERAGVPKSSVSILLNSLIQENMISIEDKKILYRIKANRNSPQFIKRKIAYNLTLVYDSDLVDYLDVTYNHPKSIILFGSFRKGADISTSDIDIAIETDDNIELESSRPDQTFVASVQEKEGIRVLANLERLEKSWFLKKINIVRFNRKKISENMLNNLANGIVLSGFFEVKT